MTIEEKLSALRRVMAEKKQVDTYIVLSSDAHQSEYVGGYWKARAYISGFTGSAGTVVVTRDKAACWGRRTVLFTRRRAACGARRLS